jgi:hypothetical protein
MITEQLYPKDLQPGDVVLGLGLNDDRRVRALGKHDTRQQLQEVIFENNDHVWYRLDQHITVQRPRT